MEAHLLKIIEGLESSAFERGAYQGTTLGIIQTLRSTSMGNSPEYIIEAMLKTIPHGSIRIAIEDEDSDDLLIKKIDELLCD